MTSTVNASTLTSLIKDTVSVTTAEACLVQAIDIINLEGLAYDITITELAGTPLTGTYTGAEKAAIITVAMAVYSQNYKNSGAASSASDSFAVGPISSSQSTSNSNSNSGGSASNVNAVAHSVVMALYRASNLPPIFIANDLS